MDSNKAGQPTGRIGPKLDKDLTNAEKIIFGLRERGMTISTAESMTAGGFGYALTRVPGSSRAYKGGVATYTKESKKLLLGLPDELLDCGLITPAITLAMAVKVLELFGTDIAVAGTGNAGPSVDDSSAGVGRVYWAIVDSVGHEKVSEFDIFGKRDDVRRKAITHGLRMLRNFMDIHET